jgi:branched-chain amino acid transport system substrate-binding protein
MKLRSLGALGIIALFAAAACTPGATTAPTPGTSPDTTPGTSPDTTPGTTPGALGEVVIAAGDPIVIGTALVITGDAASLGLDSQYGAHVAADERNAAGGVLGHDVELIDEDAGCAAAETGQTAAQALVTNDQLVAAIGTSCSRTAVPAMPVLAQRGIPMISPANTSPTLTDPNHAEYLGDFYFRTAHNDLVQGAAVATYACEQNWETAATIHDGSTYSDNLRLVFEREFAEQCGGQIVEQQATTPDETNFAGILAPIAGAAPDLVFMPLFHPAATLISVQAADIPELANTQLFQADATLGDPNFLDQGGEAVEGIIFSGPACAGDYYENEFLPAYRVYSGTEEPISVFHCHAYDAVNVILEAVEQVAVQDSDGTLRIDRQALRDAIAATSGFTGLTGNLSCDEFGDCADPDIRMSQIQGGRWVVIWP